MESRGYEEEGVNGILGPINDAIKENGLKDFFPSLNDGQSPFGSTSDLQAKLTEALSQITGGQSFPDLFGETDGSNPFGGILDKITGGANSGNNGGGLFSGFGNGGFSNLFGGGGLFGGGRKKREAVSKALKPTESTKMKLYKYGYSNQIIDQLCPSMKQDITECVNKATNRGIDLRRMNPSYAKGMYCKAEADCATKARSCQQENARESVTRCNCEKKIHTQLGNKCGQLPPTPDCRKLSIASRARTTSEPDSLCQEPIPQLDEVIKSIGERKEKVNNGEEERSKLLKNRGQERAALVRGGNKGK
jgi:hypothetical protein